MMKRFVFLFFLLTIAASTFSQICGERPPTLIVLINTYNQLFVDRRDVNIEELKDIVKEFIANPNEDPDYAEKYEKEIPLLGNVLVSKGIVSIQCDRGTSYEAYIDVQNEIERAFNELRDEFAWAKFNIPYKKLSKEKQRTINTAVPKMISEAEPKLPKN